MNELVNPSAPQPLQIPRKKQRRQDKPDLNHEPQHMLRCRHQSPIEWNIREPHVEIGWEDGDEEQYQQSSCKHSAGGMNYSDATCNLHHAGQVDKKQWKWKKGWDDFHEYLWVPEMSDSNQDEGDSIDDRQYVGKHRKWIEPVLLTWLLRCSMG